MFTVSQPKKFVDAEVQLTFVIAVLHLQRYFLTCTTTSVTADSCSSTLFSVFNFFNNHQSIIINFNSHNSKYSSVIRYWYATLSQHFYRYGLIRRLKITL